MKNTLRVLSSVALVVCAGAFAAPAQAQTLAEAAKREAARRARLTESKRVITNADLEALPTRGGAAPATPAKPDAILPPTVTEPAGSAVPATLDGAAAAMPADGQSDGPTPARVKRDEQHWRERAQVIRQRLTRLQSDAAALDGRVKALNAGIDTAPGSDRAALAADLRQAAEALARVQEELRLIQGEWRAFEDKAAEANVPPAWIR